MKVDISELEIQQINGQLKEKLLKIGKLQCGNDTNRLGITELIAEVKKKNAEVGDIEIRRMYSCAQFDIPTDYRKFEDEINAVYYRLVLEK